MALSKLHVRFIQSQKNFYLITDNADKGIKLPISQLYVKDTSNFYLVIKDKALEASSQLNINFKEKTPALNTLSCKFDATILDNGSEEHEDALLFFNVDESEVKQVLLLSLQSLTDS